MPINIFNTFDDPSASMMRLRPSEFDSATPM